MGHIHERKAEKAQRIPHRMEWIFWHCRNSRAHSKNLMNGYEEDCECVSETVETGKTKMRNLIALGIPEEKAYEWALHAQEILAIASSPILHKTLNIPYWKNKG